MPANIEFENGEHGKRAVITGPWDDGLLPTLEKACISELELNQGKGWSGNSIDFVAYLPQLKVLVIRDFRISSIEPVHHLQNLVTLRISTYCKTPIRYDSFPKLKEVEIEWRKGAESLFDCSQLEHLFINKYKGASSAMFEGLVNLTTLGILNSPIRDLEGLKFMSKLSSLRISNLRKIESLEGIANLRELRSLKIQGCKGISSLESLANLNKLEKLSFEDVENIESLTPLSGLESLETVVFPGSTNIVDGDMTPLRKLQKLQRLSYQNRRHYTHKREEFWAYSH